MSIIKKIFSLISFAAVALAQSGLTLGPSSIQWELPYQGHILRWNGAKQSWTFASLPSFPGWQDPEECYFLWGDGTLCKFHSINSSGKPVTWVQTGELIKDPDGNARWDWSDWSQLPPLAVPHCILEGKLLLEVPERKNQGGQIVRTRTFVQMDLQSGKKVSLLTFKPPLGQYFDSCAIQREGKGYIILGTGQVLVWDPMGGGSVKMALNDIFKPITDKRVAIAMDGATPYPSFICPPFFDRDGRILVGITTLIVVDKAHLQFHVDAATEEENEFMAIPKEMPDSLISKEHPKTYFLSLDPEPGLAECLETDRVAHLYRPDPGAPLCILEPVTDGNRYWVDANGHIQILSLDEALRSALAQATAEPKSSKS